MDEHWFLGAVRGGLMAIKTDMTTRVITVTDAAGATVSTRPFSPAENAIADATLAPARNAAIVEAIAATAKPPASGAAWVQPVGAHDAYALGSTVTSGGKTWVSLAAFNVWAPGVSGWREVVSEGYPAWVQPTGGHDAYPLGAKVTHNGQDWENTGSASNVWEPGVFGWVTI